MKNILVVLLFLLSQVSLSQGIKVIDVKEAVSGSDAFYAPMDNNGHPCGLIKVQSVLPDLRFDGDVVGEVDSENNEYKVYLAKGSKRLVIKRPQIMPIVIHFPDYGIDEIASKATYTIKLKEVSLNPTKNLMVIDVRPRTAALYIDDILIDNENDDGGYRILLPKGEHICKIECKGYRSYASVIKIGKGTQTINVELESLLADIEINSQTSGAHILVDEEEVGIGSWKGKLPAGTYKIVVQLEGFTSTSQSIVLGEKDNRTIAIPSLERAKGDISVITDIKDAVVYLDGKKISNPREIIDVQTGEHKLTVKAPFGYKDFEKTINIRTGSNDPIQIKMEFINDIYARAFNGDVEAQTQICNEKMSSCKYNVNDTIERNYWFEIIFSNLSKLNKEQLTLVCPILDDGMGDFGPAGFYTYFGNDTSKALAILLIWNKFAPEDYSVVLEMAKQYYKIKDYEAVVKWATRGLDICDFDGDMGWFIEYIAEACVKQGNANRAITIFKNHIYDGYGWEKGYLNIGDVYKDMGDCKNAIIFYERFLKEVPDAANWEKEDVRKKIRDCR